MESLAGSLAAARARLVAAGIDADEAAVDVALYATTLLGWDRGQLLARQQEAAPDRLEPTFSTWIERRTRHEPSAYIVGVREFFGRDFRVTPDVLIPRPETELIVDEALPLLRAMSGPRVADVGTGSGCLAVTLALECPNCCVVATDVSRRALTVARENAERLGASGVSFVETSYLDGIVGELDVIVSNPPYVSTAEVLPPPVRYEPAMALRAGDDGLRDVTAVLDAAATRLRPGGWLVLEIGAGQDAELRRRVAARPRLEFVRIRADLQGIPRTAIMRSA